LLLLRDLAQGPSGDLVWAEGELPGIGRVTFSTADRAKLDVSAAGISSGMLIEGSVAAPDRYNEDMQIAALRGGGFVNNLHWFSPGFVLTVPSEVNTPDWGLPDAWGHGLWTNREGTSELVLLGEQNVRTPRPELEVLLHAQPWRPSARPAGGGGILVEDKVLSPDGRLRTLPFVADGVPRPRTRQRLCSCWPSPPRPWPRLPAPSAPRPTRATSTAGVPDLSAAPAPPARSSPPGASRSSRRAAGPWSARRRARLSGFAGRQARPPAGAVVAVDPLVRADHPGVSRGVDRDVGALAAPRQLGPALAGPLADAQHPPSSAATLPTGDRVAFRLLSLPLYMVGQVRRLVRAALRPAD
jgi:hypothetical protein